MPAITSFSFLSYLFISTPFSIISLSSSATPSCILFSQPIVSRARPEFPSICQAAFSLDRPSDSRYPSASSPAWTGYALPIRRSALYHFIGIARGIWHMGLLWRCWLLPHERYSCEVWFVHACESSRRCEVVGTCACIY
ncbi:hypothetical protein CC77DRAFT_284529 [Alternaria alternata]|uniref:Uncharacterized protein n=1 Tax=Alternaria alternata TaxID=5599 RepID=A0A177DC45_ALTAL|nr:hypothetical protein CC77DRAFT_284529 [Alternaria alternata]OAG17255.1 hypothetical protein CC77DRAFT_284529 [Alternaria alternata]